MYLLELATLNFALAAFDAFVTRRHISRYGTQVESNRLIVWLSTRLGPEVGVLIGVLGPALFWTLLLTWLNAPVLLGILIGYNLRRFVLRLSTLQFERQLLKFKKNLDSKNSGGNSCIKREPDGTESTTPSSTGREKV